MSQSDTLAAIMRDGVRVGSSKVAYLNTDWLDQTNTTERADIEFVGNASVGGSSLACLTYTYPWNGYGWTSVREAKIRLTLSDVEHMRKVAASDVKLRAAFQKIAPHIEVVVDFP